MKTNEEKLKRLLEVAQNNGWKPYGYFIDLFQINRFECKLEILLDEKESCVVFFRPVWNMSFDEMSISLNDLVTNFEEEEISFIEALCKSNGFPEWLEEEAKYDDTSNHQMFIRMYVAFPTSQRLQWFFDIFNHLIV